MKLFLIRHGETVDNVAQVYAGVKDSQLTNHGFFQANRLGQHLASTGPRLTEIFSSDLQRASKTAEAIRLAQPSHETNTIVTQLSCLREQDFGFYEGKTFSARPRDSKKTGKEAHRDEHKNDPGFKDVESKESMAVRANSFLDENLLPLLRSETSDTKHSVVVVSHGIILSTLWRCLLKRFAPRTVAFASGLHVGGTGTLLEYLGGWSNTGYLELNVEKTEMLLPEIIESGTPKEEELQLEGGPLVISAVPIAPIGATSNSTSISVLPCLGLTTDKSQPEEAPSAPTKPDVLHGWNMIIQTINCKDHLKGLKRTGGGVGSSQFDEGQKKIETFFKKRKVG
ncbi:MAG: hypothetical protein M1830_002001 [Pleopsidium flavum]|nr:MAG: hypothetical protein M1830_002001 [Pleopsidium flavum]